MRAAFGSSPTIGSSTTITAGSITLAGDIGKQVSDGNSLALSTAATNGAINLNISINF